MKKIMFNDRYGLTQAVLEGRKTQTRRIIHGLPSDVEGLEVTSFMKSHREYYEEVWVLSCHTTCRLGKVLNIPYQIGEEVAIAQCYCDINKVCYNRDTPKIARMASFFNTTAGWKNKMFVQAALMPYHIKITDINIEHLQDISDEDCEKEGVRRICHVSLNLDTYSVEDGGIEHLTPQEAYADLIDKISGKGTWKSNPWVFVYDFELVD